MLEGCVYVYKFLRQYSSGLASLNITSIIWFCRIYSLNWNSRKYFLPKRYEDSSFFLLCFQVEILTLNCFQMLAVLTTWKETRSNSTPCPWIFSRIQKKKWEYPHLVQKNLSRFFQIKTEKLFRLIQNNSLKFKSLLFWNSSRFNTNRGMLLHFPS